MRRVNTTLAVHKTQNCGTPARRRRMTNLHITRTRQRLMASRLATLSHCEREVMDRVVEGKPDKRIADKLGISIKTVEAHRARMMGKLDVNSVAELVRLSIGWSKPGPTL